MYLIFAIELHYDGIHLSCTCACCTNLDETFKYNAIILVWSLRFHQTFWRSKILPRTEKQVSGLSSSLSRYNISLSASSYRTSFVFLSNSSIASYTYMLIISVYSSISIHICHNALQIITVKGITVFFQLSLE